MTVTDEEVDTIAGDLIDFGPLCEIKSPARPHKEERRARWIVWLRNPQPCGHTYSAMYLLVCDDCLALWRRQGSVCGGRVWPFKLVTIRTEPL